ncbi:hypothetical protein [Vibrio rarus]|uniref:hypothetical protein n=1 Tax=Vibrio rarus TaxID=413403 RepID=UPI0021C2C07E|nr:hypothetical protein [Vibrio rarus]
MRLFISILIFLYTPWAMGQCTGSWGVSTKKTYSNDPQSAPKVRVVIELSDALKKCNLEGVVVKTEESGQLRFRHKQSTLLARVTDESGRAYTRLNNKRLFIPFKGNASRQTFELRFDDIMHSTPGTYSASIALHLEGASRGSKRVKSFVQIYPYLSMDIQSTSLNNNTLDLGVLKSGRSKSLDLTINSNTSYSLSIESKYGALQHEKNESKKIHYSISLDGRTVPFDAKMAFSSPPSAGHKKQMQFKVGSVSGAVAGRYKDYVTITATARP